MKNKLFALCIIICLILSTSYTAFANDKSNEVDDGFYTVYLHFNNVGSSSGFSNFDYSSPQRLSYNTGWSFTQKKLDNFMANRKTFEYEGDKYTYTGKWTYTDGSEVTPPIRQKYTGEKEVHITICPVYDVKIVKQLTVERINPILNTKASATNHNEVSPTYSHTFENPNDVKRPENYQFLGWQHENEDYVQPGETKVWYYDNFDKKYNKITYIAKYQPAVVIEWYDGDKLVNSESSFESLSSSYEYDKGNFDKWVTENNENAEETYFPNGINEEVKTIKLYATFTEPEPIPDPVQPGDNPVQPSDPGQLGDDPIPAPEPTPTPKPAGTQKDTPTQKSTPTKSITPTKVKQTPVKVKQTPIEVIEYYTTKTYEAPEIAPIEKEETVEEISEEGTPLGLNSHKSQRYWALVNLIEMIITVIISAVLILRFLWMKWSEDEDDEEEKRNLKLPIRLISILVAVIAFIFFVITENIFYPMIMVDKYTFIATIILIIQLCICIFARATKEEDDDEIDYE